jgi:hydrogenase-1 operon protein HyaF
MGQGDVGMMISGMPAMIVQASVFAGVWMLADADVDRVEVASVPSLALSPAHLPHRPAIGALARKVQGLASAPSILSAPVDKPATRSRGALPHVVCLSILPHTPEDLAWLDKAPGEGAFTILPRGHGNCRIIATWQAYV